MSYLDSRDLYTELVELRERDEAANAAIADPDVDHFDPNLDIEPLDEDETERLKALEDLADEIGKDTMREGEVMVPVHDFPAYAEELAEDLGMIDRSVQWPLMHIDWEAAASELAMDYTEVEFDGVSYYVRMS